jgi:hypothetical protein
MGSRNLIFGATKKIGKTGEVALRNHGKPTGHPVLNVGRLVDIRN